MRCRAKHTLFSIEGDHKYTNPGGFLRRDSREYMIARRNPSDADMSTEEAKSSSIVLLERVGEHKLVDTDIVLLEGDAKYRVSYEDPRLLPGGRGFTYTLVRKGRYCSWIMMLDRGRATKQNVRMGPPIVPSKNGYVFQSTEGNVIVVSRPDEEKAIHFYSVKDMGVALDAFGEKQSAEWWSQFRLATVRIPEGARGERGEFGHIGFGTIVSPEIAVIHYGRSDEEGKYYVTAVMKLDRRGLPERNGAVEIICEPASGLPPGDVPGVIYTTAGKMEKDELVLWSGHDDSAIIETRLRPPRWVRYTVGYYD